MSDFSRISTADAKALIENSAPVVIDVRDANAFEQGALPNAIHVTTANFMRVKREIPSSKEVLVYCYHGNASQDFAQMFVDFGFDNVYSMDGGYEAWQLFSQA